MEFHQKFYWPEIHQLALNFPQVHILGTDHCGHTCQREFKCHESYHNVLFHQYYAEHVGASFAHQINS